MTHYGESRRAEMKRKWKALNRQEQQGIFWPWFWSFTAVVAFALFIVYLEGKR